MCTCLSAPGRNAGLLCPPCNRNILHGLPAAALEKAPELQKKGLVELVAAVGTKAIPDDVQTAVRNHGELEPHQLTVSTSGSHLIIFEVCRAARCCG